MKLKHKIYFLIYNLINFFKILRYKYYLIKCFKEKDKKLTIFDTFFLKILDFNKFKIKNKIFVIIYSHIGFKNLNA